MVRQQSVEVGCEAGAFVRMVEEQLDARGQQVAGGVAAGVDEQEEEPLQFTVGEAFAVDLGLHEPRRDVVAGLGALAGRHLRRVRQHLERRRAALFGRGDGVVGGVHELGELVEAFAVLARDAHQLGDQSRRQASGHVVDEVALAAFDHVVDDLAGEFPDPVAQQFGALRA